MTNNLMKKMGQVQESDMLFLKKTLINSRKRKFKETIHSCRQIFKSSKIFEIEITPIQVG